MDLRTRAERLPLTFIAVAGTVVVVAAMGSLALRGRPVGLYYDLFMLQNGPTTIVMLWLGRMVLRHRPGNGAGLVLLAIGLFQCSHVVVAALLDARLMAIGVDVVVSIDPALFVPALLPLDVAVLQLLVSIVWVPAAVLLVTMLLLVFPDGRLPSRRWRPVTTLTVAAAMLLVAAFAVQYWPTATWREDRAPAAVGVLFAAGAVALAAASAASVVALVRRWRRAGPGQRRPFQTVGATAIGLAVLLIATYPWQQVWIPSILVGATALLVVYAFAVTRLRLHDLEPVLGKAAVGAVLTVLVALVYLVVVVGIGGLVGRGLGGTLAPLVAVALVALLVEPARRRAHRLVGRLLYGRRADRTEVLSTLAQRASVAADADSVLDEVARLLVDGTGAARAEVWLEVESHPELAAQAGGFDEPEPILRADVRHQGERLGELRLYARAAADLAPGVERLLDDVAHSLGVVLRNARLIAQLRASRRRLVEAHEAARRSMERDLHDGAQAQLIALRLRLGTIRALADAGDLASASEQLDVAADDVDAAVRTLRELARGLQPPVLDQSGVAAALRSQLRALPAAVSVSDEGLGRYRRPVESALYFACLEAAHNAARHGGAGRIEVALADEGASVSFRVSDDGAGFDPGRATTGTGLSNIADRLAALGGSSAVESRIGVGTVVSGVIPVQDPDSAR